MSFSIASHDDADSLNKLVNSAYRGDTSRKGWTTEADLLDGIRTDTDALKTLMSNPESVILKYEESGNIVGCVYLEKQDNELYLGMLSVNPELQAKGIGRSLVEAAETYAREIDCTTVVMSVISVRKELITWYERRGYHLTGETKPFPPDPRFGVQKQPLEFVIMKKQLI